MNLMPVSGVSPLRVVAILAALTLGPSLAHAACASPTGNEGDQVYNADFKVMQFCNGTNWVSMAGTNASGAWAPSGTALYYNGGSIGIGTNTPVHLIHIKGAQAGIFLEETTGGVDNNLFLVHYNNILAFQNRSSNGETIATTPVSFDVRAPNSSLVITSGGNIGIATGSPGYTLHVNGSVAGIGAYNALSDARHKTKVENLSYGLADVMKLRPVTYDWIAPTEKGQEGRKVGLIAQEVEAVVPEVVSTANDPSQTKSLAYGELVPVLIHAVQELKAENDTLRADVDALKKTLGQ